MLNDLTGATPCRIDTEISSLTGQIADHRQVASNAIETLHYRVGDDKHPPVGRQRRRYWKLSLAQTLEKAEQATNPIVELITYREAEKGIAILKESVIVLQEEFARRPWSRFFEVTSSNGHVHSSTGCSTCRDTTTFAWHPELAGKNEEAAVQECGPFLCTVCFPTAPVSWTRDRGDVKAEQDALTGLYCSGASYVDGSRVNRYPSAFAECAECHSSVSLTTTGRVRKHRNPMVK